MDTVISNLSGILPLLAPASGDHTPEEAIVKAADRLLHSNDVAVRRSAVQELKSYSRQYRDLIVDNALRGLVSNLHRDHNSPEIVRFTLETLLVLFIRGEGVVDLTRDWIVGSRASGPAARGLRGGKYPSPLLMQDTGVDHISFWIADELTTTTDSVALLVDLLPTAPYPTSVYILQLLQALAVTRLERTQECLRASPQAVDALVALLKAHTDQTRNETILLLIKTTENNDVFSKALVFHADFDVFFDIIAEEGGLRGSVVVSDVLQLLSNLIIYNAVTQQLFLTNAAAGARLASLLVEPLTDDGFVWTPQRVTNAQSALLIVRMFVLDEETKTTLQNQAQLSAMGILQAVLQVSFHPSTPVQIRAFALSTIAGLVQHNPELQRQLQSFDVPYTDIANSGLKLGVMVTVVDCCLRWMLHANLIHVFSIRVACMRFLRACFGPELCLAYVEWCTAGLLPDDSDAGAVPTSITNDVTGGVSSSPTETSSPPAESSSPPVESSNPIVTGSAFSSTTPNILLLLTEYSATAHLNPYQYWYAAGFLTHIFQQSPTCQGIVQKATVGVDGDSSFIQTISGLLVPLLKLQEPRVALGYLQLLAQWMYEDPAAVSDFLEDGSTVHALVAYLSDLSSDVHSHVKGLVTVVLGTAYEFSKNTSPISREALYSLLKKTIGDNYGFKIRQFRQLLQDFDPEAEGEGQGLPLVFFNDMFVTSFIETFPRLVRALAREPSFEPMEKITFEAVEALTRHNQELGESLKATTEKATRTETSLRSDLDELSAHFSDVTDMLEDSREELAKLEAEHQETSARYTALETDLERLSLLKGELEHKVAQYEAELRTLQLRSLKSDRELTECKQRLERVETERTKHADGVNKMSKELIKLLKERDEKDKELKKMSFELKKATKEMETLLAKVEALRLQNDRLVREMTATIDGLQQRVASNGAENQLLREAVAAKEAACGKTEEMNREIVERLRAAAKSIERLEAEKNALEEQLVIGAKEQEAQVTVLRTEVATLKEVSTALEAAVATAQAEAERHQAARAVAETTVTNLEAAVDAAEKAGAAEVKRVEALLATSLAAEDALREGRRALAELLSAVETEKETLKVELESAAASASQSLELLTKENERLSAALASAQALADQSQTEVLARTKEVEREQKALAKAVAAHAQTSTLLAEAKAAHLNLLEIIKRLETEKEVLSEQVSTLESLNTELRTALKNVQAQHKDAKAEVGRLSESVEEMAKSLKKASTEAEKAREAHRQAIEKMRLEHASETQRAVVTTKALEAKLEVSEKEKAETAAVITSLEAEVASGATALKTAVDQAAATQKRLDVATALSAKQQTEVTALETAKAAAESQLQAAQAELVVISGQYDECVAQTATFEKEREAHAKMTGLRDQAVRDAVALKAEAAIKAKEHAALCTAQEKTGKTLAALEKARKELIASHEAAVAASNERGEQLETTIKGLQTELEAKATAIENERQMLTQNSDLVIKNYSVKIGKLERTIQELEGAAVAGTAAAALLVTEKTNEIQRLQKEVTGLKATVEEATAKVSSLSGELVKVGEKLEAAKAVAAKEVERLEGELAVRVQEAASLNTERTKTASALAEAVVSAAAMEARVQSLTNDLEASARVAETEAKSLRSDLARLNTERDQLVTAKEAIGLEVTREKELREASVAKLQKQATALLEELAAAMESKQTLETELAATAQKHTSVAAALSDRLEERDAEVASLASQLRELQTLPRAVAAAEAKTKALELTVSALEKKALALVTEAEEAAAMVVKKAEADQAAADQAVVELTQTKDTLEAKVRAEGAARAALEQQVALLQAEMAKQKEDTDDLMLVMTDMEEKYKAQIVQLGGEVSGSEDEE